MKITFTVLFFFCICTFSAMAQKTYSVKGTLRDSVANVGLFNSSVSVLNAKDSTLRKFVRANSSGAFNLSGLGKGSFILLVTYPDYADYVEKFTLDSVHTDHNFGNINMSLKSRLLKEVLIKGTVAAVKIKGDTTEYNAKAFVIQPNSKVEDLLKQLPGIQVDKDGKITAQGQTVKKVLVDGEEFFGDDPTLVTKNIRGDMVDKVQLYDKTSDQAAFTGIDDGDKTKTINIKLKEDKKNGYFGKIDAGVGTDGFYQGQALFNKFKGKKKFSAYGTLGNTGKTGLGWEDNNKLGTGGGLTFGDDGGAYFDGSSSDNGLDSFSGNYEGEGIPVARTGGVHYDDKWKADKYSLNTNYKIGSLSVDGMRNTITQQNLPDASNSNTSIINSVTNQTFNNYMFRQKLDATYSVKLDSTATLKFSVDGTLKNSTARTGNQSTRTRADNSLLNQNDRSVNNDVDQQLFNATVLYTKKLKKKGRTLSVNVNTGFTDNKADGFLKSNLGLYDEQGQLYSSQIIDQQKIDNTKTSKFGTNVTYTEPFSKYLSMILSYGINFNNSDADRRSYDQSAPGNYNLLNDSLSNHYIFNQVSNQGGLNFNYKKGKSTLRFGTRLADVTFNQKNQILGTSAKRSFINWNPTANYQYKISTYGGISLNYYGSQTQPTLDQLQPIRVNTDPLNVVIGNPGLTPSFTHRVSMWYNMYKVLSEQSIWLNGSYNVTTNPIVNSVFTDSTGKSTIQAINLSNQRQSNFNLSIDLGKKVTAIGMNVGARLSANGNIYYNMVTTSNTPAQLNRTNSNTYSGQITLSKYKEKKYQVYIDAGPDYSVGQSSVQPNRNNNARGFNASYYIEVYLPLKFKIGTDAQYQYKAATQSIPEDFSQTIVNASLTKSFLKSEALKLSLQGRDLLNQNSGFSRNSFGGNYTQSKYTTIRRYFMLSVVWDFSGMGGGTQPKK